MTSSHFLPPDHGLHNTDRLAMPGYVAQRRYDMICPPVSAFRLVERLPRGKLI